MSAATLRVQAEARPLALASVEAVEVIGISKNTLKAMQRREDLVWLVRDGALNRKLMRVLGIKY